MSTSSTCDGCESADPVYLADLGASAIGPDPDPHLAPARCWLCADCHPHLDEDPPIEAPPDGGPSHAAEYVCGRVCLTSETACRQPVAVPWAACADHDDAPVSPHATVTAAAASGSSSGSADADV